MYHEFCLLNMLQILPLLFTTFLPPKSKPLSSLAWTNAFSSLIVLFSLSSPLIHSGAEHSIWSRTPYEWWMVNMNGASWVICNMALIWSNLLKIKINHNTASLKFFSDFSRLLRFEILYLAYEFLHDLALSPSSLCFFHRVLHSLNSLNPPYPEPEPWHMLFLLPGNIFL